MNNNNHTELLYGVFLHQKIGAHITLHTAYTQVHGHNFFFRIAIKCAFRQEYVRTNVRFITQQTVHKGRRKRWVAKNKKTKKTQLSQSYKQVSLTDELCRNRNSIPPLTILTIVVTGDLACVHQVQYSCKQRPLCCMQLFTGSSHERNLHNHPDNFHFDDYVFAYFATSFEPR